MINIFIPTAEISIPIYWLIILGVMSGSLTALCGVGGNVLSMPVLLSMGIPPVTAITTLLAQVLITTSLSVREKIKHNYLRKDLIKTMIPGSLTGATLGIFIFIYLQRIYILKYVLNAFFVIFLLSLLVRNLRKRHDIQNSEYKKRSLFLISLLSSLLPTITGIGAGFVIIPYLRYKIGVPIKHSICTSLTNSLCTLILLMTLHYVIGNGIDIILLFSIAIPSMVTTYIITKIDRKIPESYTTTFFIVLVSYALLTSSYTLIKLFID